MLNDISKRKNAGEPKYTLPVLCDFLLMLTYSFNYVSIGVEIANSLLAFLACTLHTPAEEYFREKLLIETLKNSKSSHYGKKSISR